MGPTEEEKIKKATNWLNRNPVNTKTLTGKVRIGRNEPCYCGSGKKFGHCCFSKHAVLPPGTETPALMEFGKKYLVYQAKQEKPDA